MKGRRLEPEPKRDWSNWAGAEALAELIRRYWRDRGFPDFDVRVEPLCGGREPLVVIKSRLGSNGLPPYAIS